MNKTISIVSLVAIAMMVAACGQQSDQKTEQTPTQAAPPTQQQQALMEREIANAWKITEDFIGSLKGELKTAMKEGGPQRALEVCQNRAMPITDEVGARHGVELRRVSLKPRNPANTPNAWQKPVLEEFDTRAANGDDPKMLAFATIVEVDGKKQFRFMKAMPVGKVCLNCHGAQLKPEVTAKLKKLYPEDKATGYSLGQIRGAVVIVKDL